MSDPLLSALSLLKPVASACLQAMPEGSWWGLKFLDPKYLGNWNFSPNIEVFRYDGDTFRVKLSGSHEIDPSLSQEQLTSLHFLGWASGESDTCDCLYSTFCSEEEALAKFESALNVLQVIFGVSEVCAIYGSNDYVNAQLEDLSQSRWSRKYGGFRLVSGLYNRIDLR